MQIAVVVPSEQYMALAGVRIRYQRIAARLEAAGHSLDMLQIADFRATDAAGSDVYIFSKCYDARSYLAARALKARGKLIGVDMFDDYFGQSRDSRFVRQREWLRTIGGLCDFFLCSTPRMRDVVAGFMPGKPGHVLNDPFHAFNPEAVASQSKLKLARARSSRHIDVVWFGVGDNPNFPIGLKDLAAYGGSLARFRQRGFTVDLRILTNRRALTVEGLSSINRLSVPFTVEEWSESREAELLSESLIAFIPVNAQPFSIAKSLNRAVTAITGGAQVLSPGYPLYQPLFDYVYSNADEVADDIFANHLKIRGATMRDLVRTLAVWGNPDRESEKLAAFMEDLAASVTVKASDMPPVVGVIHGQRSPADCHKAAQRLGYLSIGSPFSSENLNYDVRFIVGQEGTEVQFSEVATPRLLPAVRRQLKDAISPRGKSVKAIALSAVLPGHPFDRYRAADAGKISRPAIYADTIHLVRDAVERLIPDIEIFLSELDSPLMETSRQGAWSPPVALDAARKVAA